MIKTDKKIIQPWRTTSSGLRLVQVNTRKDWDAFFKLPWTIYKNDRQWVPPLLSEQKKVFSESNPFFLKANFCAWLVFEVSKPVGRIVAYVDNAYNNFHNERTGFFGFFECMPHEESARLLLEVAQNWLQQQGMNKMIGPVNFDTGNECGVLIKGTKYPPYLQMAHTPVYYKTLLQNLGFTKVHDLLAFCINLQDIASDKYFMNRLSAISNRAVNNDACKIRSFLPNHFNKEIDKVHFAYNNWMKENWGFSPVNKKEIMFTAAALKSILKPDLILFAQNEGQLIGCCISLPDINQVICNMNGKLFPFGIFRYFYYKPKIDRVRLMLLAVSPAYRNKGLDTFFCHHSILKAIELGFKEAELSWVSEENTGLINILKKFKAELYKVYRVFGREI